ncbi:MAG TPA: hypothetical protein VF989_03900, partial [Polyangiaceae bacterium]
MLAPQKTEVGEEAKTPPGDPTFDGDLAYDESPPRALARRHRSVQRGRDPFLSPRDLDVLEAAFAGARRYLREERHDNPSVRAAAEWMLDNHYLVDRVRGQLRHELPQGFQQRLPRLAEGGRPRALAVAEFLYDGTGSELSLDELEQFLEAYQEITALTIAELWALPALVRFTVLVRLRDVLERTRLNAIEPSVDPGTAAGRAIRALRLLAEIDWKEVFCRQSVTERLLLEDPARAYGTMDFETRDAYRRAVEEIAWSAELGELEVSRAVLERAREGPPDSRHDHVGFWLLGPGRTAFERVFGAPGLSLEQRLLAHPRLTFFGLLSLAQLVLLAPIAAYLARLDASIPTAIAALILCWFPASVPATTFVHWLLAKLLRPRLLPKLDFGEGIPERFRTLVVVPT